MRSVDCVVCGSKHKQTVEEQHFKDAYLEMINPTYQNVARRLVVCEGCGFVYHDPQLDSADTATLYEKFRDSSLSDQFADASFKKETPDEYFDRITRLPKGQSENQDKVDWLGQHFLASASKAGWLLDIGCGGGVFIYSFLQNNPEWTACGVEPTPSFAELAGRRLGKSVVSGNYQSGLFPQTGFDLITINQVLEHVLDPVSFLQDVRKDLAPGGHVYIEVPDILDLAYLSPEHDRFRMQHLWVFSKSSLANVCQRAGYRLVFMDQQVTVRGKRNVMALMTVRSDTDVFVDLRDDPAWVLSLRQQYQDANT